MYWHTENHIFLFNVRDSILCIKTFQNKLDLGTTQKLIVKLFSFKIHLQLNGKHICQIK